CAAANGVGPSRLQSARLVAAVAELGSLAGIGSCMNKRVVIVFSVALAVLLGAILVTAWLVPRSMFLMTFVEHMAPGVIPAGSYARNLDSQDPDLVRESLAHLTDRKDPIGLTRGVELLQSTDDYIWLNAAHYTGMCGRQEAVPYLIKALDRKSTRLN